MIEVKSVIQNSFSELFGGLYSGSLAILTDAAHLLTDMSSFIISLVAIHLSERPGMSKRLHLQSVTLVLFQQTVS